MTSAERHITRAANLAAMRTRDCVDTGAHIHGSHANKLARAAAHLKNIHETIAIRLISRRDERNDDLYLGNPTFAWRLVRDGSLSPLTFHTPMAMFDRTTSPRETVERLAALARSVPLADFFLEYHERERVSAETVDAFVSASGDALCSLVASTYGIETHHREPVTTRCVPAIVRKLRPLVELFAAERERAHLERLYIAGYRKGIKARLAGDRARFSKAEKRGGAYLRGFRSGWTSGHLYQTAQTA